VWRLRVYVGRRPNGTPIQVTRTVHGGVRKADSELADMVSKAGTGRLKQSTGGPTVAEILEDFLKVCELKNRSATTVREYRRIVKNVLVPAFGEVRAQALTAKHLDRLYLDLK